MSKNKRDQKRDWGDNQTSSALTPEQLAAMGYGLAADVANGIENISRPEKIVEVIVEVQVPVEVPIEVIPEGAIVPHEDGTLSIDGLTITPIGVELPSHLEPEQWQALGRSLLSVGNAAQWCLGDWLVFGEEKTWGETYKEMAREFGYEIDTLYTYAWLSRKVKISIRNRDLSPAHHRLVAKFDEEKQRELLEWAATGDDGEPVKISQMRDKIRSLEKKDPPALPSESIVNPKFDKKYHGMFRDYNEANSDDQLKIIEALRHLLHEMERRRK